MLFEKLMSMDRNIGARASFQKSFNTTIIAIFKKAIISCESAREAAPDHSGEVTEMIVIGRGAKRSRIDYHLTRHACYLIVENANPEKPVVALGQAYFAYQTRRQELSDEDALAGLTENQRCLLIRGQLSLHNVQLAETASLAGIITAKDFAIFQDYGYRGLYNGLGAKDIHARKELKKGQKILDYMNSSELAVNLFRSTQAEERIRHKQIHTKEAANQEHLKIGEEIHALIEKGRYDARRSANSYKKYSADSERNAEKIASGIPRIFISFG